MAGTYFATFRSRGPEPPPAKGCNLRSRPRWLRALTCKLKVRFKCTVCCRRAFVLALPAHAAGHRLLRTPHAGGAFTFLPTVSSWRLSHSCKPDGSRLLRRLCDQKSKQKSRRECDFPVGCPTASPLAEIPCDCLCLRGSPSGMYLRFGIKADEYAS